jgi:IS30 family transposase
MKHLTQEQRYTISVMAQQGFAQNKIAEAIGKHKSTISRELLRNCDNRSCNYNYLLAQNKCEQRHKEKPKNKRFSKEVKQEVESLLRKDFSPEQVSGRLKLESIYSISHETIYQHVWNEKKKGGTLFTHLRRKGRKYRKRGNSKDTRGIIKDRITIDKRPKIVDRKRRFGDLEIDTIIGKNHKGAILTINDRVSSMVWIANLKGKNAQELASKTIEILSGYKLAKTITADNGKEFAKHKIISEALGVDFYFADPYHSWQRGANENTNGLIRQYFPKGTSFENITDQDIMDVQNILNNRPRKKINFLTPHEFFDLNLSNNKVAFMT